MAAYCNVSDVLMYMEIPTLDEDDLSEDDFDGYINEDEQHDNPGSGDGQENDEDDGSYNDGGDGNESDDEGIPEFVGSPGDMSNKSPVEFLQLFLTDKILLMIVEQTNLFAQQHIESHELS